MANWDQDTEFLVIVNHYDHDVSWSKKINLKYIIYEKEQPDKEPFSAVNKGKSETNLLKFCYDFYDSLPRNVITVHQYERKAYHNGSIVDILNDPNLSTKYQASKTLGYMNLNTYHLGDVDLQIPRMKTTGWWEKTMEPWFGPIEKYHNFTRDKIGCSQFIVSRERIRSLPRNFYSNMYQWYVDNVLDEKLPGYDPNTLSRKPHPTDKDPRSNWYTSRYLEWTWELIFASHKKWENLPYDLGGLYKADAYHRNVTHLLHQFVKDGILHIPRQTNLNSVFGDPCHGTIKELMICVKGKKYFYSEKLLEDIIILIPERYEF